MTGNQLRAALEKLDINQLAFARLMKCDGRTVRHWIFGDRDVPAWIEMFVRLLVSKKLKPEDIERVH